MNHHDPLNGKRVLVIGFSRQGQSLARWLPGRGASVIVNDRRVAEELDFQRDEYPDVEFVFGKHPLELINEVEVVCVSGGVPLTLPLVRAAFARNIPVTNDAQLFMERCPAPVIGITGSAGKTTTTTLAGEILEHAGYTTWVGGNIGNVLLDDLPRIQPDHRVVMELSSFQLELMTISPQVAVVLNITPNHLDRHGTMENYMNAKANILQHQRPNEVAILCRDDFGSRALEPLVTGEIAWFSANEIVADGVFLAGKRIILAGAASYDYVPHVLCETDDIPLRGKHNISNVLAACAIAGTLGLATDAPGIPESVIREAVTSFKPVPHRLEIVRQLNGVTYVNDSIATAPERLIAAMRSFDEPLILLLGGTDKDLPWDDAVRLALEKSRHIVLFGKSGKKQVREKVFKLLQLLGIDPDFVTCVDTLDAAVQKAAEFAQPGDVVLLSPGGTSYDAYVDFAGRGEHFRRLVAEL